MFCLQDQSVVHSICEVCHLNTILFRSAGMFRVKMSFVSCLSFHTYFIIIMKSQPNALWGRKQNLIWLLKGFTFWHVFLESCLAAPSFWRDSCSRWNAFVPYRQHWPSLWVHKMSFPFTVSCLYGLINPQSTDFKGKYRILLFCHHR